MLCSFLVTWTSAFMPIHSPVGARAPEVDASAKTRLLAVDDTDFEGVDVVKLLGARQLQRMKRKKRGGNRQTNKPKGGFVKDPVKIIIAGAPASGKGTQCEVIKQKFGVVHLSTGDMLRAAVAAETEVGKQAKEYMDSGKLVPDEVIIGVVSKSLPDF